eukprot:SAG11_NODE_1369_length_5094_cov_5.116070_1_plen_92_part_00
MKLLRLRKPDPAPARLAARSQPPCSLLRPALKTRTIWTYELTGGKQVFQQRIVSAVAGASDSRWLMLETTWGCFQLVPYSSSVGAAEPRSV